MGKSECQRGVVAGCSREWVVADFVRPVVLDNASQNIAVELTVDVEGGQGEGRAAAVFTLEEIKWR